VGREKLRKCTKKEAADNPLSVGQPLDVLSFSPKVEDTQQ
jgi:hypothetical protein